MAQNTEMQSIKSKSVPLLGGSELVPILHVLYALLCRILRIVLKQKTP